MMADWPMASFNSQRTGYSPTESLPTTGNFMRSWFASQHRDFAAVPYRDGVYPQISPVVSNGHVVICTTQGRIRSYTATHTSKILEWTCPIPAPTGWTATPVVASPVADTSKVYVADVFGRLTAINLSDGSIAWGPLQITDYGPIQGALLLFEGMIMFGGADGKFRFINPSDGSQVFQHVTANIGQAILQGAAGDSGTVVVGAADGKVYAFNTSDGSLKWASAAIRGVFAFKDYYPVIINGIIYTRPLMQLPDVGAGIIAPTRGLPIANYLTGNQDDLLAYYDNNHQTEYLPNLIRLNLSDGSDAKAPVHHYWWHTMNGAAPPVCLNAQGNIVFGGPEIAGSVQEEAVWLEANPITRKIIRSIYDTTQPLLGSGNPDENMTVVAVSNAMVFMHLEEGNATETWAAYTNTGNIVAVRVANVFPTLEGWYNTQGGGASVAAISNGLIYHNCHPNTLTCLRRS